MKTQKAFLIVIAILASTAVALQIITMMKKNKLTDTPQVRGGVDVGDLTQEIIED